MRINQYVAAYSSLSRRAADRAITSGKVTVNNLPAQIGQEISSSDKVYLNGSILNPVVRQITILFHKPVGYVCSRKGQGNKTIYELLPKNLHHVQSIGRLDKNSSGLLVLTNNGNLTQRLSHPSFYKIKTYTITLDHPLSQQDQSNISKFGVHLTDGLSKLSLQKLDQSRLRWKINMHEGRNRQIRRTFQKLGYQVVLLHRISFANFKIGSLQPGQWTEV